MSAAKDYSQPVSRSDIETAAKALEKNGFAVTIVDTIDAAKEFVLNLVPAGAEVFTNTSQTLETSGLAEALNGPQYVSLRDKMTALYGDPAKKKDMKRITAAPDYALGSVHAVTKDGRLLIGSNSGSQIPSEAYGADNVIFVVGAQKIVEDLNEGIARIEKYVVPLEDARAQQAYGNGTKFRKLFVYNSEVPGRTTVVLIAEAIGF